MYPNAGSLVNTFEAFASPAMDIIKAKVKDAEGLSLIEQLLKLEHVTESKVFSFNKKQYFYNFFFRYQCF